MVSKPRAERDTRLKQREREKEREKSAAKKEETAKAAEAPEAGGEEAGAGGRGGPGRERDKGPQVDIRITDASGQLVRKLKAPAKLGVNRFVWDLTSEPFKEPPRERQGWERDEGGPEVTPGTYTITIRYKDDEVKGSVQVLADPRVTLTATSRQANWDAQQRAGKLQEVVAEAVQRIKDTSTDADVLLKKVNAELTKEKEAREQAGMVDAKADSAEQAADPRRAFVKRVGELKKGLTALEKRFWLPPDTKGIAYEDQPLSRVQTAQWFLGSSWDQPTPATLAYLGRAERELDKVVTDFNKFFAEDVASFRKEVEVLQVRLLPEQDPLAVPSAP